MRRPFFLLVAIAASVQALDYDIECVNGIRVGLGYFTFAGQKKGKSRLESICTGTLNIYSTWAAAKRYCSPTEIAAGNDSLSALCEEWGYPLVSYESVLPNLTDSYMDSLPVVEFEDRLGHVWDTPILMSEQLFSAAFRTMWYFDLEYYLHVQFGNLMYAFWGLVLLIGIIHRFRRYLHIRRQTVYNGQIAGSKTPSYIISLLSSTFEKLSHWTRTYMIIPPAFGSRHKQLVFWCEVPTRIEAIVVFCYYALSIFLCSAFYYTFEDNLFYVPRLQALRFIADRTGIMSYANLPILWLFSGRNNIFLWATGWQFSTFHLFHRHIARVATIQGLVHTICYVMMQNNVERFWKMMHKWYWIMGTLAIFAMCFLLIFSSVFIRHKTYEFFLVMHFLLAAVTIYGLFYHTNIFAGHYDGYILPLIAIWALDRGVRLVRQIYCNLHVSLSGTVHPSTATAMYNKESDLIRLYVTPGSKLLKPGAHQYYFIYQPMRWKFWENHPFTLGGWENLDDPGMELKSASQSEPVPGHETLPLLSDSSSNSSKVSAALNGERNELLFYIRPFNGYTAQLRDECLKSTNGIIHPKILIEGPYGTCAHLHTYEKILLIAGGTGIAAMTSYFKDHVARLATGTTDTKEIILLWTAKQAAMIQDIAVRELAVARGCEGVETHFYASRQYTATTAEPTSVAVGLDLPNITISHGRPDISAMVTGFVSAAEGSNSAVFVCGPAAMADEARNAVQKVMRQGITTVEYFEESFGW